MRARVVRRHHLSRDAAYRCPSCEAALCQECAVAITVQGREVTQCGRCQAMLDPLVADQAPEPGAGPYGARLAEFLAFPLRRDVLFLLLGLAVLVAPLQWALAGNVIFHAGLVGLLLTSGLEMSIYFHLLTSTAYGSKEINPPDFEHPLDDLVAPLVRYLAALAPLIGAGLWLGAQRGSWVKGMALLTDDPVALLTVGGPAVLAVVGIALLPLLTIIAAVSGSVWMVLNPVVWWRALRVTGGTYPVAAAAFYAVLAVEALVWLPLLAYLREGFSIPIVTSVVTLALSYLPMALRARLLGGLVEPYLSTLRAD